MKKTLQINIAGIVFTIEDDAYEKLTAYLKAIEQYFSKYEDSREIISDIENRVAEKFFNKKSTDNQQVISIEQVNQVVASMGSVADFEAIEEDEDLVKSPESEVVSQESEKKDTKNQFQNSKTQDPRPKTSSLPPQKYFRDTKRKALGGVLAGLAYHFKIDVVWLRLIYLVLFLGISPLTNGDLAGFSAFLFIAYMVCWVAFPPNNNLEEDTKIKKFYRNPDQKVISGVCSGLAAYFGIDLGLMRFIFVIMGFAGFGIIAYILLWIVAPKATTLTQKMEMKGEPVTLENIETNIKSNLNLSATDQETPAAKILLLPFRIIATVLNAFGQIFKNLGPVVRVFAGIILLIISISWIFALLVGAAAFFGITAQNATDSWLHFGNIPTSTLARDIHPMLGVLGFLVFFLPAVAIGLIGLSLIANKTLIGNRTNWLTGLGLWIVSCLSFGTMIGNYMLNFSKHGEHEVTKTYPLTKNLLVLDTKDKEDNSFFDKISVELEGYEGTELKLVETFKASGNNKNIAEKNASIIDYKIIQKDSSLLFDNEITIPSNAKFRKQALEIKAYLPYNQAFTLTERFVDNLLENDDAIFDKYDLDVEDIKKYRFVMKKDSGIICLNCSLKKENNDDDDADNDDKNDVLSAGIFAENAFNEKGEHERNFDLTNFQKIEIGGAMVVNIKQGNAYKVTVDSDEKDAINDLNAKVVANTLKIYYHDFIFSSHNKQVRVTITMPKLEKIQLSGASLGKITGFNDKNDLEIELSGASRMAVEAKINKLSIEASGASKIELVGSAEKINADISGASNLNAKAMKTTTVQADASGASSANFGNVSDFHENTSGASKITRE